MDNRISLLPEFVTSVFDPKIGQRVWINEFQKYGEITDVTPHHGIVVRHDDYKKAIYDVRQLALVR